MKKIILALIFLNLLSVHLYPQEIIDLKKAVNTAIDNNPGLQTVKNNLDIQKLVIKNTKGDLYPTLGVTAGWNRNNSYSKGGTIFQNGFPIAIGDQSIWQSNLNLGINSQVTLFNGFANYKSIDIENENFTSLTINYEKLKYDILINIYTKYFDVIKKEYIVKANEDNLKNSIDQLEKIKVYVDVGKRTLSDIYKQDSQVAQDELNVESSKNDFEKAKIELLAAMNDNLDKEISVSKEDVKQDFTLEELEIILAKYSDSEKLLESAITKRYDYQLGKRDIQISEMKLDLSKRQLYSPTISAFGNYNLTGSDFDISKTRTLAFGFSLNYPIFQGFNLEVPKQIAEVNIKQKSEDLKELERSIRASIKKSIIDLQTSYKQIEILERNLKAAEQDKYLSEENFRIGYGTLLDVQVANTRVNNLLIQRINSYYNFFIAVKQIEYLSGILNY